MLFKTIKLHEELQNLNIKSLKYLNLVLNKMKIIIIINILMIIL